MGMRFVPHPVDRDWDRLHPTLAWMKAHYSDDAQAPNGEWYSVTARRMGTHVRPLVTPWFSTLDYVLVALGWVWHAVRYRGKWCIQVSRAEEQPKARRFPPPAAWRSTVLASEDVALSALLQVRGQIEVGHWPPALLG
jgi:hypothetical protein